MKSRYIFTIIILFLLLVGLVNTIQAAPTNANAILNIDKNKTKNKIAIPEQAIPIEDPSMSLVNDVVFPPEDVLMREMGITLEQYFELLERNATRNRNSLSSVLNEWGTSPTEGQVKIPVLLVDFNDSLNYHKDYMTKELISKMFNSEDINYPNNTGISVSKYWDKESYGDLNVYFDVQEWKRLPQNKSYYSTNMNYYYFAIEVINAFQNATPSLDYAQYDVTTDSDERLDGVIIIYAGTGATPASRPFTDTRPTQTIILNGTTVNPVNDKTLGNTVLHPEILGGTTTNIGTPCGISASQTGLTNCRFPIFYPAHEFGHVLGLPDVYATSGTGQGLPTNFMNSSPGCYNKPINLDVWSRYFLGWVNPVTIMIDSNITQTLRSINDYPDAVILRNNTLDGNEFFIFENRYISGDINNLDSNVCFKEYKIGATWVSGIVPMTSPTYNVNGGILAYHIDENYINANYGGNSITNYTNQIMVDPDNNYYDDSTNSHPGIVWEQNYIIPNSNNNDAPSTYYSYKDFYTSQVEETCNYSTLNNTPNTSCGSNVDTTTKGYNNPITNISLQALSPSGYDMNVKVLIAQQAATPTAIVSDPQLPYDAPPITVRLDTIDDSPIYYTTDGTIPSIDSNQYTEPIVIHVGTTTIKAVAKTPNLHYSDIYTNIFVVTGCESGLNAQNKYVICSVSDLNNIRLNLAGNYILGKDIDMSGINFEPIGIYQEYNPAVSFSGSFDGDNYTISNLNINRPVTNNAGLFGCIVNGANITNVKLENINVIGGQTVGGLVGEQINGTITNSYTTGTVSGIMGVGGLVGAVMNGTISGSHSTADILSQDQHAGGLIGGIRNGTITNCNATGNIIGHNGVLGGLIGSIDNGTITNCHATGNVSGDGQNLGGLIGSNSGTISKSYSTGTVSATGNITGTTNPIGMNLVGGLIGYNDGDISECYSLSNVSGISYVGGFVGLNNASGIIYDSYSRGNVTRSSGTDTYFGGFVGKRNLGATNNNNYSTGSVSGPGWTPTDKGFSSNSINGTSNYWDINTSGQTSSASGATGETTTNMKILDTFSGWDFTTIWNRDSSNIINSGYPYLRNNLPSGSSRTYITEIPEVPIIEEIIDTNESIVDENTIVILDENTVVVLDENTIVDENAIVDLNTTIDENLLVG